MVVSRQYERLKPATLKKLLQDGKPCRVPDGRGLYANISGPGAGSFLFRYERDGRGHWVGLGSLDVVTLPEAREKAHQMRRLLDAGKDPLDEKEAQRARLAADAASKTTFAQVVSQHLAAHGAGWDVEEARQWRQQLADFALPVLGQMPVGAIGVDDIHRTLEPIWASKTVTAARVRRRIEAILDFAKVRGLRSGDNPARWAGGIKALLPAPTKIQAVQPHAALPYKALPALWRELAAVDTDVSRGLRLLILTGLRTSELREASWPEFDLQEATWTIPAARMKMELEHCVPLSAPALAILAEIKAESVGDRLFHFGPDAMRMLTIKLRPSMTPHGFRSTFRDWIGNETDCPHEVAEHVLAHAVGNRTTRAYRRGDAFDKRVAVMADWAAFVTSEEW